MEEEENGPLFDGVVLTIIPSEELTVRSRNDVRYTSLLDAPDIDLEY